MISRRFQVSVKTSRSSSLAASSGSSPSKIARFIVLDFACKEAGRWHLLFVPADDDDLAPKQGRQGVFDGHLGGFVEDDGIEEAGLRLEYAARHVGRHEPNGPQSEQGLVRFRDQ
ncbi:MAG: hypothetical protein WDN48_04355 [Pseudolabrys sp.]